MSKEKSPFATIEEAIKDIQQGRMIIIVDDEDRENEGDLTVASEKVTADQINFMAKFGRGLICLTLTEERSMAARTSPPASLPLTAPRPSNSPWTRPLCLKTSTALATFFRCERARAACWCAPAKRKPPSISPGWPASPPRASSAR
jgi:hypothetical protein